VDQRLTFGQAFSPDHDILDIFLPPITIINVYLHPRLDRVLPTWTRLRNIQYVQRIIIRGDFNTHHRDWDSGTPQNPRRDMLSA